jgi:hypothetical protein
MEGMRFVKSQYNQENNWLGYESIEVISMNFDGEHGVLVLYDDKTIAPMVMADFKDFISDNYYEVDKAWLRDRKLKSIGI